MSVIAVNKKSSPIVHRLLSKLKGTMTGRENCTYKRLDKAGPMGEDFCVSLLEHRPNEPTNKGVLRRQLNQLNSDMTQGYSLHIHETP